MHAVAYVGLILLLVQLAAPDLLQRAVLRGLQRAGVVDPAVLVRGVSVGGVQLADLVGQDGRISIGAIDVRYSPGSLWHGRLEQIDVTGLQWLIVVRDGRLDLALPRPPEPAPPADELAFSRLNLRHCAILVDYEGLVLRIPFRGALSNAGRGRLDVDLWLEPMGLPLRLAGRVDTRDGVVDLTARGVMPEAASTPPRRPPHGEGRLTQWLRRFDLALSIAHHRDADGDGRTHVHVRARSRGSVGDGEAGWGVDGLDAQAEVAFDDELRFSTLQGHLGIARLILAGQVIDDAMLAFEQDERGLRVSASLADPSLGKLAMQAELSRLEQWLEPDGQATARLSWTADLDRAGPLLNRIATFADARFPPAAALHTRGEIDIERHRSAHPERPWRFGGGRVEVDLAATELATRWAEAEGAEASLRTVLRPRGERIEVRFDPDSTVAWRSLSVPVGEGEPASVGPGRAHLAGLARTGRESALLGLRWTEDLDVAAEGALVLGEGIEGRWDAITARADESRIEGRLTFSPDEGLSFDGALSIMGGRGGNEDYDIAADDLVMMMPLRHGGEAGPPDPGRLLIGSLERDGRSIGSMDLMVAFHDGLLTAEGEWPLWEAQPARVSGSVRLLGGPVRFEAKLRQPPVDLSDADPLRAVMGGGLDEMRFAGRWNVIGEVSFERGRTMTSGRVGIADGRLVYRDGVVEVERINGAINFTDLLELRTPANQRLTLGRARAGELELTDGYASFHIEPGPKLAIATTFWKWDPAATAGAGPGPGPGAGAGQAEQRPATIIPARPPRIAVRNLNIDLLEPTLRLDLHLDHVELLKFLDQATDGGVRGSGPIVGSMQLILTLPTEARRGHLQVFDGHFSSVPNLGGRLEVADADWRSQIVQGAAQTIGPQPARTTIMAILDQSLQNYRFRSLRAAVFSRPQEDTLLIELRPQPDADGRIRGVGDLDVTIGIDLGAWLTLALGIEDLLR